MSLSSTEDYDLRIVLLGKTGSGKSATGNTILERKAFTSEASPSSVTKTCEKETGLFDKRTVTVVDTPGIFDTSIMDDELFSEIEKCIMLTEPGPHIFLLVIRLDVRFTEEEKNAIKRFKDNFGEEVSNYTLVLFTRGDELKAKSIETFLYESPELKAFVSGCKAGYTVFENSCMEDRTQVADLFENIDKMVQLNGYNHYTSEMYKEAQRKKESKQYWSEWGDTMSSLGNTLLLTATATALPLAGVVLRAESVAVASGGPILLAAGSGISKAIGRWMKPKTDS